MDAVSSREFALTEPETLTVTKRDLGVLRERWVRVKFAYCAICGSDLSTFEGRRMTPYPASLGHEFVAQVAAVGAKVVHFKVGDIVTSDLNFRCGKCEMCSRGRSHLCEIGQIGMFSNRAFADYADIDSRYLYPIHAPLASHFALIEPLSCVLHARNWADPTAADRILVLGAGGIGLCLAYALSTGPLPVAFDIFDRLEARVRLLENAAAPFGRGLIQLTETYDVVFDASGTEDGLRLACEVVKRGGRICSMSHLDGYGEASFLLGALTRRDVDFKVSYLNGEPMNVELAAHLLATHWNLGWQETVDVVPFESLQTAFALRRESASCKTIVAIS